MRISQLAAACVMSITCAVAHPNFVYTNNNGSVNTVSAFLVGANGDLTPIPGSPFPTGGSGTGQNFSDTFGQIATTFAKDFLYLANAGDGTISAFSIDIHTGRLSPVSGSPFPVGAGDMTITPDDKFLIVAGGSIAVNRIEANGALVPVAGSPFTTVLQFSTAGSFKARMTPDGRFLAMAFTTNPGVGGIAMFSISSSGVPTLLQEPGFGPNTGNGRGIDCNCDSNHLYVGTSLSDGGPRPPAVVGMNIASNGVLSEVEGSPFFGPEPPGTQYGDVLLSRDDSKLFVANRTDDGIAVFDVKASNGALSLVTGSPFSAGLFPGSMGTDETGTFLYSADVTSHSISAFHIAADGALTPVAGSPFPVDTSGNGALSLTVFPPKICCSSPEISAVRATPDVLWPPNSKLVEVAIDYSAMAACPNHCALTVSSNEPPAGAANGTTSADWRVVDAHHVLLRAARVGSGHGRVYTITITCTNQTNGLSASHTVTVQVPHDRRH